MPQDKDFKRLVRQRMIETGERYTGARAALESEREQEVLTPQIRGWLSMPRKGEESRDAYQLLQALPIEVRRSVALAGLRDPDWRVRSRSAQLLDDLALTNETQRRLIELLDDEHIRVRMDAFHTLTCEHCKPEACEVDIRAIADKLIDDPNPSLRRGASQALCRFFDGDAIAKLRGMISDPNPRLRREAPWRLAVAESRRKGYETFLSLEPSLRARLEQKYLGKWVAVSEGKVISAHESGKLVRREVRGLAQSEKASLCFVAPPPRGMRP